MTENRRKNYYIKKKFQIKVIRRILILLILEVLMLTGLQMYVTKGTLITAYYGTHIQITPTWNFFMYDMILISVAVVVIIGIAAMLVLLYVSHKIAGPLFKFESALETISKGDVSFRLDLRKDDQLEDIRPRLNETLENLDGRLKKIKDDVREAESILKSGKSNPQEVASQMSQVVSRLKEATTYFKTSK